MTARATVACIAAAATALGAGLAASEAAARTTATLDGTVVTFTVPIDLIGLLPTVRDPETGLDHDAAPLFEELVELIWNEQLAKLRYRECITFKLDIQAQRKPAGGAADPGHHGIRVSNDPTLRSGILIPGPYTRAVVGDSQTSYLE